MWEWLLWLEQYREDNIGASRYFYPVCEVEHIENPPIEELKKEFYMAPKDIQYFS